MKCSFSCVLYVILCGLPLLGLGVEFTSIAPNIQLAPATSMADIDNTLRLLVSWPSTQALTEKNAKGVGDAVLRPTRQRTLDILQAVLQEAQRPPDMEQRLIPLRDCPLPDRDAWVGRWGADKYQIQVKVTIPAGFIVIRDLNATPTTDEKEMRAFAKRLFARVFQQATEINEMTYLMAKQYRHSASFERGPTPKSDAKQGNNAFWYRYLSWWTDGQTILVLFPCMFGEAQMPTNLRIFPSDKFTVIPGDVQLVNTESLAEVPKELQAIWTWPSAETLAVQTVTSERGTTLTPPMQVEFMKRVIEPRWLPDEVATRFTPIRNYPLPDRDAWIARWGVEKYQIQLIVCRPATYVLIRDTRVKDTPHDEAGWRAFAGEVFANIFQRADEIAAVRYRVQQRFERSAFFERDAAFDTPENTNVLLFWYGSLQWWTDGQTLYVGVPYLFGQPQIEQELRMFPPADAQR